MILKGVFVSIEGIDGSGKTTLKEALTRQLSSRIDIESIREPGGTVVSEKIRHILLDSSNDAMIPRTEALLYAAARSQVVDELIRPALEAGKVVLADRYLDSTIAYQGYGRGLPLDFLSELNRLCTGGLLPDLTLLLDVEPDTAAIRQDGRQADRLEAEGLAFQTRIRQGYLAIARDFPGRVKVLDAAREPGELLQEALEMIESLIKEHGEGS